MNMNDFQLIVISGSKHMEEHLSTDVPLIYPLNIIQVLYIITKLQLQI